MTVVMMKEMLLQNQEGKSRVVVVKVWGNQGEGCVSVGNDTVNYRVGRLFSRANLRTGSTSHPCRGPFNWNAMLMFSLSKLCRLFHQLLGKITRFLKRLSLNERIFNSTFCFITLMGFLKEYDNRPERINYNVSITMTNLDMISVVFLWTQDVN